MKIEGTIASDTAVAKELWMRPVAVELVEPDAEQKPVEYEDAYPKDAHGNRPPIFVNRNGRPISPWDFQGRREGGVVYAIDGVDVTPDPKSTMETPLPPIKVEPFTKVVVTGRAAVRAAIEEKLAAAVAVDKAAIEAAAEPIEGVLEL